MKLFTYPLLVAFWFVVSDCQNGTKTSDSPEKIIIDTIRTEVKKSPDQLRAELKELEEETPMEYLAKGLVQMHPQEVQTRSAGFFHSAEYEPDGAIFDGVIINRATLGRFKDARVKISFYSKTNSLIETQSYVIYEYLEPQSETPFSIRTASYPSAYDSFRFEITGASVAD